MSYAPTARPRPRPVKGFARGRPARPIQGVAAKRPPRTARVRTNAPGLGDYETYLALSKAMRGRRPVKSVKGRLLGQLENHSDYEYGMGDAGYGPQQTDSGLDYEYAVASDGGIGDDYSDSGGMGNWFTDAISRPFEAVGLTSPDDPTPTEYIKWRASVMAKGHTVGRMPTGAQAGEWAEIAVVNGKRLYAIAPPAVLAEDARIASIIQRQKNAGQAATTGTNILNALKPPNLASSITGIPSWVFPFLIVGGGYMVLKSVLPPQRSA